MHFSGKGSKISIVNRDRISLSLLIILSPTILFDKNALTILQNFIVSNDFLV